tara:strand:+ start:250 stop:567 length:318 start_codon:yes stop_codon:yes gene_type:complete
MSKAKHRGLREYTSEEAGNAALGQLGFKVITAASGPHTGYFNCIKVIGSSLATAHVDTIALVCSQGDDITLLEVVTGEIIYGAFTSVTTTGHSNSNVMVLCYHAK